LLSALVQECALQGGTANIFGTKSLGTQQPWIFSGTVEDNITFFNEDNPSVLDNIIKACCLESDLNSLSNGLQTKVGESGVNLSGGQKARIALARTLYSDADVIFLDDPLASLDARVSQHVFQNAILKRRKDQTIVMVSNNPEYFQHANQILVVENGTTKSYFSPEQVEGFEFTNVTEMNDLAIQEVEKEEDDFEDEEDIRQGSVSRDIYLGYFQASPSTMLTWFAAIAYAFVIVGSIAGPLWLAIWTNMDSYSPHYLVIYSCIGFGTVIISVAFVLSIFRLGLNISSTFHDDAVKGLLCAPLHFFHTNPVGRIINRLSSDVSSLDLEIAGSIISLLMSIAQLLSIVVLICVSNWILIILFVVLFAAYFYVFSIYQQSNREFRRIESVTKSPVNAYISESLVGLSTIRSFGKKNVMMERMCLVLDNYLANSYIYLSGTIWMEFRLGMLSSLVTLAVGLIGAYVNSSSVAFVALALTNSSTMTAAISEFLVHLGDMENQMNSVERLNHYRFNIPQETSSDQSPDLGDCWPKQGTISVKEVDLKYPSAPEKRVLNKVSLEIKNGQKVGIVGRTGSGKSSLVNVLFRLFEIQGGEIKIDGIDIAQMQLSKLRQGIEMISQEPVVFEGTLRENLDPFESFEDDQLWAVLDKVGLKSFFAETNEKLDFELEPHGQNISIGQRQLLCIARSVLKSPKILVLDEATASVDQDTDEKIQLLIKREFSEATVISIAHRLHTVADYDLIAVLDRGNLIEMASPLELLQDSTSAFYALCKASGERNFDEIIAKAFMVNKSPVE
jgi:ABC-type multidrug transport system fused ATPase/permease subunit